jgi:hypothetical protein
MDVTDIVDLKTSLEARDSSRKNRYDEIMDAVGGDYDSRRMDGFWERWEAMTTRNIPTDRRLYEFKLNIFPSIIDAKRGLLGTIPSISCPPKDNTPEARALSEKLEDVLMSFWHFSHIGKRMNQLGYWNPTLGTTIGVVWPDMVNKRPKLLFQSPYDFYPVVKDVDGYELSQAIFVTKYKGAQADAMYPGYGLKESNEVEFIQYFDKDRICTIADSKHVVQDITNKCGFVPIVIIPNISFGEGPWGDSDIEWAIPIQDELNYRMTLENAILEETIMQPLAIEAGDNLPDDIPMGPRDAIPVQPGGKVYRVAPVQVPYQYLQAKDSLFKLLDRVLDAPDVLRSQFEGSVLTGRGVSSLMGPLQSRLAMRGNEIYPAMAELNKMAMKMWAKMFPKETTVYHQDKGSSVTRTFKPSEFGGWYENIVYVDVASYYDAQSRFITILQAVQNRLMSRKTAMKFIPGVENVVEEDQNINDELKKDQELAQASQGFAEANVQPDMGQQGATNANLSKGYSGETPPMEPIGGFEPPEQAVAALGGEMELGEEGLGFLEMVVQVFEGIPKLKGRVWLAGYIVMDPQYSPQSENWNGIEVYLENPQDKATIANSLRNEFPELHGNITFHVGRPSKEEPSIPVADPNADEIPMMGMEEMMGGEPGAVQESGSEAEVQNPL